MTNSAYTDLLQMDDGALKEQVHFLLHALVKDPLARLGLPRSR